MYEIAYDKCLLIELKTSQGTVGVVHADVPAGLSCSAFVQDIHNPQIRDVALWGRGRIIKHFREGVPGVWRVSDTGLLISSREAQLVGMANSKSWLMQRLFAHY